MKTLIGYFLLFALIFSACEQSQDKNFVNYNEPFLAKVLVNEKGKLKAMDERNFLKRWESQVYEMQGVKLTFENPKIVKQKNGTFILVATSTEGTTKMATVVTLENGQIKTNGGSTCTCTGCTSGCDPKHISGNKWECTACTGPDYNCKKSVTASEPVPDGD